jgi:4-oxalocrotonate tautomerase
MPFVNISLFEGRTDAQKKAVAGRISQAMCEEWGLKPEHIWIRFEDTRMEDWFTGSESAADIRAKRLAAQGGD